MGEVVGWGEGEGVEGPRWDATSRRVTPVATRDVATRERRNVALLLAHGSPSAKRTPLLDPTVLLEQIATNTSTI